MNVTNNANIKTTGEKATGLIAQSIGGSGGNGGFSISGAISGSNAKTMTFALGGSGATGGNGGKVGDRVDHALRELHCGADHRHRLVVDECASGIDISRSSVPVVRSRSIAIDVTRNMIVSGKSPTSGAPMTPSSQR